MRAIHPIIAVILMVLYFGISLRLFIKKKQQIEPIDLTLAQLARIALLFIYLNGLVLSMNMKIPVNREHHYASLIPAAVMFVFQFLPKKVKHKLGIKGYAIMFLLMGIAVIIIAKSGRM